MDQGMPNRIRELRESRGLSGTYMAEIISVSPQYFYDLEKGRRRLNETMIKQLALFFVVTADYLLGLTDDPAPPRYLEESNVLSIPAHLAPLLDAAKDLPPEKIEPLVAIAKHMGSEPSRKQVLKTQKYLSFRTTKSSRKSDNPWSMEDRPAYDADFLCRLLKENIIKPTIYGHPLTREQKEGLIKFIESQKDLLSNLKENDTAEKHDSHSGGEESLDLKKETELAALMDVSRIIVKMMHRYLCEEKKIKNPHTQGSE